MRRSPLGTALVTVVVLVIALIAAGLPLDRTAAAAGQITYTYEVRGRGNATDLEDFAARAAETYADARGWGLGGSIRFARVAGGGDFTLWLSAPQYLPAFSSRCSIHYSCRVGRNVIINEVRFRGGSTSWNATGAALRDYQHMVVNHETGHWLGFGHAYCAGAGQRAPLMQQQSISMQGCQPNAWPTDAERGTLSRNKGVPIVVPPPPPPPGPPPVPAGTVLTIPAAGAAGTGIPGDAEAVGVNLTVTGPVGGGYLTAYPCGTALPATSNLNYWPGQTIAGFTLVAPGTGGAICVRTSQAAHIVIDVSGFVPAGSSYQPVAPQRLLDSRAQGARPAGTVAVSLPAGAAAAALTITVTEPVAPGYVTVHPCDQPAPLASTLNFVAGQNVANLALAKAGNSGRVCLRPSVPTHLVVDLVGTYPSGSGFTAQTPRRLLDTRSGPAPGGVTEVALPTAGAHALNLTVTQPSAAGWVRAFPCGAAQPPTSNINFATGDTVANALISAPGAGRRLCLAASAATHLVLDDSGTLTPADYQSVSAVRLLDTRLR